MISVNLSKLIGINNDLSRQARAAAFLIEYDPLAGKHLRGEATQQELIDKAEEIRARFPYQT